MSVRLVNIMQACAIAGVSRRTIYNWLASGRLSYVRTAGGSVRIDATTLFQREHLTDEQRATAWRSPDGRGIMELVNDALAATKAVQ